MAVRGIAQGTGGGGGGGTVTQVNTGTGLTGGPITSTGTISIADDAANTLAGFDNSGAFDNVAIGTGLSLSGGTLNASATTLALEVNDTPNADQTLLNLVAGTNLTITDNGGGSIRFDNTGAVAPVYLDTQVVFGNGVTAGGTTSSELTYDDTTADNKFIVYQPGTGIRFQVLGGGARVQVDNGGGSVWFKTDNGGDVSMGDVSGSNAKFLLNTNLNTYTFNKLAPVSGTDFVTVDSAGVLGHTSSVNPTLNQFQIGVGDASNLLSGSANLTFDATGSGGLKVNGIGAFTGDIQQWSVSGFQLSGITSVGHFKDISQAGVGTLYASFDNSGILTGSGSIPTAGVTLTNQQIPFGDSSNLMTSSTKLIWNGFGVNIQDGHGNTFINAGGGGSATGGQNIGLGANFSNSVLSSLTTGTFNTAVGPSAGSIVTSGDSNTLIGSGANVSTGAISNSIAIGNGAVASADNQFVVGNGVTHWIINGANYTVPVSGTDGYLKNTSNVWSWENTIPSGSVSLTYKQVAYGNSSNLITSDVGFKRDPSNFNSTLIQSLNGSDGGQLVVDSAGSSFYQAVSGINNLLNLTTTQAKLSSTDGTTLSLITLDNTQNVASLTDTTTYTASSTLSSSNSILAFNDITLGNQSSISLSSNDAVINYTNATINGNYQTTATQTSIAFQDLATTYRAQNTLSNASNNTQFVDITNSVTANCYLSPAFSQLSFADVPNGVTNQVTLSPTTASFIANDSVNGYDSDLTIDVNDTRLVRNGLGNTGELNINTTIAPIVALTLTGPTSLITGLAILDGSLSLGVAGGNQTVIALDDATGVIGMATGYNQGGMAQVNTFDSTWTDDGSQGYINMGDINGGQNSTTWKLDDVAQTITSVGTIVESAIDISNYVSNSDYSAGFAGKSAVYYSGSTGTPGILLPTTTIAPVGTKFTMGDLDGIAAANNITVDAGTGNTINGITVAQTYVINQNGQAITIQKVSATAWKII